MKSFPYYERIVNMIKEDMLDYVEHADHGVDSKKQKREVHFILHFANGKKYNVYKGKAKPQRIQAVFNILEKKGHIGGETICL